MKLIKSIFLFLTFFITISGSAPKANIWNFWDEASKSDARIDSADWQYILDKYLVKEGNQTKFKYNKVSKEDKKRLEGYIKRLTLLDPRDYSKKEQFSYWVNLYNALTVNLIIDNYPIKSITKLGGTFSFGPWDKKITTIKGKDISLNDIEHRILRPIWKDKRIHYVVNCASIGCPNLSPYALTRDNQQKILEMSAKEFINSKKGVFVDGDKVRLSEVYNWYKEDFGDIKQLEAHINNYRDKKVTLKKLTYDYNWDLNEKK